MKTKYLLLFLSIVVISGCSSAYRTTQTPDDVYFSPAPPPPVEYVNTASQQQPDNYASDIPDVGQDLAIRRGINDPMYRSNPSLDFGFGYNPYDYYGSSLYSPYTPYYNPYTFTGVTFYGHGYNSYNYYSPYYSNYYSPYYSNSYYAPFGNYYPSIYVSGGNTSNYHGPRTVNLGAYNSSTTNRVNTQPLQLGSDAVPAAPVRTFQSQPVNRTTGVGNLIRRVFTGSSDNTRSYNSDNGRNYNSNNNSNSSPARSSSGGSSGGSSSGSSGSAPVRTFR
jgi:hypothetical protein